jgi:transcriptional regulator with XRE-family HTH domain
MAYIDEQDQRLLNQEQVLLVIGIELNAARIDHGISIKGLARKMKKSINWIERVLNGEVNINLRTYADLFYYASGGE